MNKTIVVVDDHEAVRELFCRDLERSPEYEVVGQTGIGLEAIRLIKKSLQILLLLSCSCRICAGTKSYCEYKRKFLKRESWSLRARVTPA
jgi:DNA-binding NarL/FixJ family response regulator